MTRPVAEVLEMYLARHGPLLGAARRPPRGRPDGLSRSAPRSRAGMETSGLPPRTQAV